MIKFGLFHHKALEDMYLSHMNQFMIRLWCFFAILELDSPSSHSFLLYVKIWTGYSSEMKKISHTGLKRHHFEYEHQSKI